MNRREALKVIGLGMASPTLLVQPIKANTIKRIDEEIIPTGMDLLDYRLWSEETNKFTGGMRRGIVTIIGQPGSGKTILGRTIAHNASKHVSVGVVAENPSLERGFFKDHHSKFEGNLTYYNGLNVDENSVMALMDFHDLVVLETFLHDYTNRDYNVFRRLALKAIEKNTCLILQPPNTRTCNVIDGKLGNMPEVGRSLYYLSSLVIRMDPPRLLSSQLKLRPLDNIEEFDSTWYDNDDNYFKAYIRKNRWSRPYDGYIALHLDQKQMIFKESHSVVGSIRFTKESIPCLKI